MKCGLSGWIFTWLFSWLNCTLYLALLERIVKTSLLFWHSLFKTYFRRFERIRILCFDNRRLFIRVLNLLIKVGFLRFSWGREHFWLISWYIKWILWNFFLFNIIINKNTILFHLLYSRLIPIYFIAQIRVQVISECMFANIRL